MSPNNFNNFDKYKPLDLLKLKGGLVVSCQAFVGEPMYGSEIMARFAQAAMEGGAVAIRVNSPQDVAAIKRTVNLPLIGLWKRNSSDSEVYITPTLMDIIATSKAGADIVAMDATLRPRPNGGRLADIVKEAKSKSDCLLMADISTVEEGLHAVEIGFDMLSTTLSGYTAGSPQIEEPDYTLVEALAREVTVPVFAEGRICTPHQARRCLECGAFAVVVGTAITRPQVITRTYVEVLKKNNIDFN